MLNLYHCDEKDKYLKRGLHREPPVWWNGGEAVFGNTPWSSRPNRMAQ